MYRDNLGNVEKKQLMVNILKFFIAFVMTCSVNGRVFAQYWPEPTLQRNCNNVDAKAPVYFNNEVQGDSTPVLTFGAYNYGDNEYDGYAGNRQEMSRNQEVPIAFASYTSRPYTNKNVRLPSKQGNFSGTQGIISQQTKGLVRNASLGTTWSPSLNDKGLEVMEANISFTTMFPVFLPHFRYRPQMTLLSVTPNFKYTNLHYEGSGYLPNSLYTGGVTTGLFGIVNERWKLMANVMPKYSGDGQSNYRSLVCPAMLAAIWTPNEKWNVTVGVIYLDRSDIPILPIGGAIYTPHEDWRFELTAPQVNIARRLNAYCSSREQNWLFIGGGFSGSSWSITSVNDQSDYAMSREYVIKTGWEHTRTDLYKVTTDVAYVFGRQIQFDRQTQATIKPSDSLALRLTVSF
ncbi:MAG: hypothetical protein ACRC10_03895 [Thermoguttaceae bacterium]